MSSAVVTDNGSVGISVGRGRAQNHAIGTNGDNRFTDLSFLEHLPGLTQLSIGICRLKSFAIPSNLRGLKYLEIGANEITDFTFLRGNPLTNLASPGGIGELIPPYSELTHRSSGYSTRVPHPGPLPSDGRGCPEGG